MIDFSQIITAADKEAQAAQAARDLWKSQRAAAVASIKVTTAAGNVFDGDEVSQGRMARAVLSINAAPAGATTPWVLADNTVINATADELLEAMTLAGIAQGALWVQEQP